jgi:hypothetical protein
MANSRIAMHRKHSKRWTDKSSGERATRLQQEREQRDESRLGEERATGATARGSASAAAAFAAVSLVEEHGINHTQANGQPGTLQLPRFSNPTFIQVALLFIEMVKSSRTMKPCRIRNPIPSPAAQNFQAITFCFPAAAR